MLSSCPGCGLAAPDAGGPAPEEQHASSACWALYGELLSRSYSDPARRAVHQVVVDAYAAQHAGSTSRRAVQNVALCLMTLCLVVVEDGIDPADGPALHKQIVAARPRLHVACAAVPRGADDRRRRARGPGRGRAPPSGAR